MLVLSGPSGSGKTTLACRLLDRHGGPGGSLVRSVSVTTRPARSGECGGGDYLFVSEERFAEMRAAGELLEDAEVYGHRYGTPRAFVEESLRQGRDVLLVLDARGKDQLEVTHPAELVSVFLLPPSRRDQEERLRLRRQDEGQAIACRLEAASAEVAASAGYDYVLVNRDLEVTLVALDGVLRAERLRRGQPALPGGDGR